ncbi:MAG: MBOAT family protein [Candidatus Cloacimonetes bacterium]|nr:MBOAT family protein [Candidatus Cloacimonadota bacterium]
MLVSSYVFYGWWDWRFLSLIAISTLVDYWAGRNMARTDEVRKRKLLLLLSLTLNLGLLGFFKYFNFFIESTAEFLTLFGMRANLPTLRIILPVGISFYTFQTLSYTIDIYRHQLEPEKSLLRFAVFVAFFPQLVAGPIVRARLLLPQLRVDNHFDWNRLQQGVTLVIWGYFLKVGLADSVAVLVDAVYGQPRLFFSSALITGTVFYAFQIYGDFCGYSSIAIGIARMLGFDFGINFNKPYFAVSFSDFWKRWHISLSSWLRDYLYIPLGGNRSGKWKTYRNLMLTMLLGGLWHGAAMRFIIWGGLHGIFLVVQRLSQKPSQWLYERVFIPKIIRKAIAIPLVFALVCITWIFFRAGNLSEAMLILRKVFRLNEFSLLTLPPKIDVLKGSLLIAFVIVVDWLDEHYDFFSRLPSKPWLYVSFLSLVLWLTFFFGNFFANAFIYFVF